MQTTTATVRPSRSELTDLNNGNLLHAARAYASAGWPVLPLTPRAKTPLGNLVPRGLLNASTDLDQIERWWQQAPTANIGLRTGVAFDVLDLDGPPALQGLALLAPGYQHRGPVASTGKGYHLLFEVTGAKNGANLRDKIDFRGQNGYIVASPSTHPNGHQYAWTRNGMFELPEAPDWLMDLLFPPAPPRQPPSDPPMVIGAALSALDIVAEFQRMGCQLRRSSNRYHTTCLFHADSTPSLVIYPETQSFYCFGCGAWGDALNLLNFERNGQLR